MVDSTPISTPVLLNHGIGPDPTGEKVYEMLYHSMIGSLMYLIASRPDIMYPTCLCARYQSNPKVSHLTLVKRILQYLQGCPGVGLWYPRDDVFELRSYSDSDYGSCKLNAKSTTVGCQVFGSRLVTWQYKKQTTVSLSTCEAEYVASSSCCSQITLLFLYLLGFNGIKDLGGGKECDPEVMDSDLMVWSKEVDDSNDDDSNDDVDVVYSRICKERTI
ncbi:secreted RxLR effector protein 161-like [Bidens hawaiensis]|uniref:secreted RxLR effector protein 161-like n=1 Tax=Bidens hawaiensis TaxID=980011 RepID=UPI0040491C4C